MHTTMLHPIFQHKLVRLLFFLTPCRSVQFNTPYDDIYYPTLEIQMTLIMNGILGVTLLTLGRKLFWLFVGCVGFVIGFQMATQYFMMQPFWVVWGVALFCGVIGSLLGLFFQNMAILFGGFAAGATITTYFITVTGLTAFPLLNIIGGIIGAIVLYALFDWALIALSSMVGATLIMQSLNVHFQAEIIIYAALLALGILFQAFLWRKQSSRIR